MYDLYSKADYEGTHTLFEIEYPCTVIVEAVLLRILTPPLLLNS